ncbi:MAG TPA: protein kinase [Steroidobacteraceae bacterium]|nr:protein kinase [Steroidobacteraceae bacterium]
MRLLLIEEDTRRCDHIRRRLASCHPQAQLIVHSPVSQGALAPEFLAQGFDAVLLADAWPGGRGLNWARDLASRAGFAPLVLLCDGNRSVASEAGALGAYTLSPDDLDRDTFSEVLAAAEQRQAQARAVWRSSRAGRETQRFGDAFVRGYRCIRRLTTGPMTDLFVAESERAGTLVALKVARDRQGEEHRAVDMFQRFLQEYDIAQRIASPAVVRLHDLGVSDEHAWLVMEYFELGDLRKRMRGTLTPREALRLAGAIARALTTVHAAGVLHRDLKPGNIMLRSDGSIALIDFGLSKDAALALDLTDTGTIFGTPHYMSPEQGHAEAVDARSDLYSLGVILYEMLTGEKPYRAENPMAIVYKHRKEPIPQLPARFAEVQPLLERLLAKAPADRFATAQEAGEALQATLDAWLARGAGG